MGTSASVPWRRSSRECFVERRLPVRCQLGSSFSALAPVSLDGLMALVRVTSRIALTLAPMQERSGSAVHRGASAEMARVERFKLRS